MLLFDRTAQLLIAEPGKAGKFVESLRIQFSVKKTNKAQPNAAIFQVTNMDKTSRNRIGTTGTIATLQAGYKSGIETVSIVAEMDVIDVNTVKAPPEITTSLTCADGVTAVKGNKQSRSYIAGKSAKGILSEIVADAGLTLRSMAEVADDIYNNGFSESGTLGDFLDTLTGKLQARWSMQNGEVQVTPLGQPAATSIILLNEASGMIGSPQRRNKVGDPKAPAQKDGWVVRSLLRPEIEPDAILKIVSEDLEGQFRVVAVSHTGDTHGNDFFTDSEVEEYD